MHSYTEALGISGHPVLLLVSKYRYLSSRELYRIINEEAFSLKESSRLNFLLGEIKAKRGQQAVQPIFHHFSFPLFIFLLFFLLPSNSSDISAIRKFAGGRHHQKKSYIPETFLSFRNPTHQNDISKILRSCNVNSVLTVFLYHAQPRSRLLNQCYCQSHKEVSAVLHADQSSCSLSLDLSPKVHSKSIQKLKNMTTATMSISRHYYLFITFNFGNQQEIIKQKEVDVKESCAF